MSFADYQNGGYGNQKSIFEQDFAYAILSPFRLRTLWSGQISHSYSFHYIYGYRVWILKNRITEFHKQIFENLVHIMLGDIFESSR